MKFLNFSSLNGKMTNYVSEDGETLKTLRNVNLNDAVASGRYYCISCTNTPENIGGYLDVYTYYVASSDTYIRQVYRPYNSDYVYERKISGATWSEWKSLNNNFKYKIALNFSSSEATQTVTLSDCIGFVPVAFTVNAQRYAQLVNHYFSDLSFDSQTGLLTVTRVNASAYATAQLGIFFMRQPS